MSIGIAGVGLIGGSVGLAARERLGAHVVGTDPDPGAVAAALERGAIDAEGLPGEADVVFVCAPVGALPAAVGEALAVAREDAVVTDVGSTKRALVAAQSDPRFIGGHPLAGAERGGVENARADLFDGATWYLTPGTETAGVGYERLHRLIAELGARPTAIDPEAHDRVMASVSHLPHVVANVLVGQAVGVLGGEKVPAIGPSFRDLTRVAGAPTGVWRDIYLANADALRGAIDDAVQRLSAFRDALGDGEMVAALNDAARADRARLLEAGLAAGAVRELRVSVPNRPGVVADIALALGRAGVNIADMALYPAPDNASGTVALWVAGETAAQQAREALAPLELPVADA